MTNKIDLNIVAADFEQVRARLLQLLSSTNTASWAGILPTQTGQTIVDLIATVGASDRLAIAGARQDAYAETARSARALYALADTQGLRIPRKIGARTTVMMTNNGTTALTVRRFTQFQGAGTYWYNGGATINLVPGVSTPVELTQGYVVVRQLHGLGTPFQTYETIERDFSVSDKDVMVELVSNADPTASATLQQVNIITDGLWNHKNLLAVEDRTTAEGRLRLMFGTSTYGYLPSTSDLIRITYAVNSGADGNNIAVSNKKIQPVTSISNLVISTANAVPAVGGANQPPASLLRTVASSSFGTFDSAVTRTQYHSVAMTEAGMADVRLYAQREIDPTNLALMNVVRVYGLLQSGASGNNDLGHASNLSTWNIVREDLQRRGMFTTQYVVLPLNAVPVVVNYTIYCKSWATLDDCKAAADAAVTALFAPRYGYIGYNIAISDIVKAILNSHSGIEYVDVFSPTKDVTLNAETALVSGPTPGEFGVPPVNGYNLLPNTSYDYAIVPLINVSGQVYSAPPTYVRSTSVPLSPYASDPTRSTKGYTFAWRRLPDEVGFSIFRRLSNNSSASYSEVVRYNSLGASPEHQLAYANAVYTNAYDMGASPIMDSNNNTIPLSAAISSAYPVSYAVMSGTPDSKAYYSTRSTA